MSDVAQCPRMRGGQCVNACVVAILRKIASTASESAPAPAAIARASSADRSDITAALVSAAVPSRSNVKTAHISLRYGQVRTGIQRAIGNSQAANSTKSTCDTAGDFYACGNFIFSLRAIQSVTSLKAIPKSVVLATGLGCSKRSLLSAPSVSLAIPLSHCRGSG